MFGSFGETLAQLKVWREYCQLSGNLRARESKSSL
jgi:hypothetical protein